MRTTQVYCDHCNREIDTPLYDHVIIYLPGNTSPVDLCLPCQRSLLDQISRCIERFPTFPLSRDGSGEEVPDQRAVPERAE